MKDLLIIVLLAILALTLFWPGKGLAARWLAGRKLAARARQEDALKHILKAEVNGRTCSVTSVAGALRLGEDAAAALLAELEKGGLLSFEKGMSCAPTGCGKVFSPTRPAWPRPTGTATPSGRSTC
jgi:hypothetical protein